MGWMNKLGNVRWFAESWARCHKSFDRLVAIRLDGGVATERGQVTVGLKRCGESSYLHPRGCGARCGVTW